MQVLILGGTGAMGIHVSKILSSRGNKVVVTSRKPHFNISMRITYNIVSAMLKIRYSCLNFFRNDGMQLSTS